MATKRFDDPACGQPRAQSPAEPIFVAIAPHRTGRGVRQANGFCGQPKAAILHQGAKGIEIVEVKIYGHGGGILLKV
jgi:hypothetical protein